MRALHLLLMACVLWCAAGFSEPAEAAYPSDPAHVAASSAPIDDAPNGTTDPIGEVHHHHCPLAPDLTGDGLSTPMIVAASAPAVRRITPLSSLTRAPPLQPPATA